MALPAVSDPIVADAANLQEPGSFNGARGKDDAVAQDSAALIAGGEVYAGIVADPHDLRAGQQLGA